MIWRLVCGFDARGANNDIDIESGNVSTEDENCFLKQAGLGLFRKRFRNMFEGPFLPDDQEIIVLQSFPILTAKYTVLDSRLLPIPYTCPPSRAAHFLFFLPDPLPPPTPPSQTRPPLKNKQIPFPIARPDPPMSPNRFSTPARELLQCLHISSISNKAFITPDQAADNEAFGRSTVAVEFYCVCL